MQMHQLSLLLEYSVIETAKAKASLAVANAQFSREILVAIVDIPRQNIDIAQQRGTVKILFSIMYLIL